MSLCKKIGDTSFPFPTGNGAYVEAGVGNKKEPLSPAWQIRLEVCPSWRPHIALLCFFFPVRAIEKLRKQIATALYCIFYQDFASILRLFILPILMWKVVSFSSFSLIPIYWKCKINPTWDLWALALFLLLLLNNGNSQLSPFLGVMFICVAPSFINNNWHCIWAW